MPTAAAGLQPSLVIREREPLNLEYPFEQLSDLLTPNDLFYVRSHFKAPAIDREAYRLSVGGAVTAPLRWNVPATAASSLCRR